MTTSIERVAEIIDDGLSKDPEVYDALFGDEHVVISPRLAGGYQGAQASGQMGGNQ